MMFVKDLDVVSLHIDSFESILRYLTHSTRVLLGSENH